MKTIQHINDFTNALLVFIPLLLTLRAVMDGMNAYDESFGLKMTLSKIKKRIKAAIIAITISSIVGFFKGFFM